MTTNTRGNLTKKAYELISSKIINLEFKPGEKISEKMIENNLGIGRTPIREALLKLKQERLINVIPQSGTYVTKIDLEMVKASSFIRAVLERQVMLQVAEQSLTHAQIEYLTGIIEKQQLACKNTDYELFFKYSDEFHRFFYKVTDHLTVWNWLHQINLAFQRFRFLHIKVNEHSCMKILKEQKHLLKAIIEHNMIEIDKIEFKDLQLPNNMIEKVAAEFPEYFTMKK